MRHRAGRRPDGAGVDPGRLAGMTAALAARGPDDEAFVLGGMGHWRGRLSWGSGHGFRRSAAPLAEARRSGAGRSGSASAGPPSASRPARAPADARPTRAVARLHGELYNADTIRDSCAAPAAGSAARATPRCSSRRGDGGTDALTRLSGMLRSPSGTRRGAGSGVVAIRWASSRSSARRRPACSSRRRRARSSPVSAPVRRRTQRRSPRTSPPACSSRRADVLQRHHPDRRRLPGRDRRCRRRGAPLGAGPGGGAGRLAAASRGSTTRSIAPSPAIASATARPAPCSAAASTARRSCSAPRREARSPAPLTLFTAAFEDAACDERDAAAAIAAMTPFAWQVTDVGAPSGSTDPRWPTTCRPFSPASTSRSSRAAPTRSGA